MSHKPSSSGKIILKIHELINIGVDKTIYKLVPSENGEPSLSKSQDAFILTRKLNHLVDSGKLCKNTTIEINEYSKSVARNVNDFLKKGDKIFMLIEKLIVLKSGEMAESSSSSLSQMPQTQTSNPFLPPASKKIKPNPYVQIIDLDENYNTLSEWKIRGRVTAKSKIRSWQNAKGSGTVFSIDVQDETGQIRVTSYNNKFYHMIEYDKVYIFSNGHIKLKNEKYNTLIHMYEVTLNDDSDVQRCSEDEAKNVPKITYNFLPISQISDEPVNAIVDVIGVCSRFGELKEGTAKGTGRKYAKRDITLVDNKSDETVTVTLWGDRAVNFNGQSQPVILVKAGRISEYGGVKAISLGDSSSIVHDPDVMEARELRDWWFAADF